MSSTNNSSAPKVNVASEITCNPHINCCIFFKRKDKQNKNNNNRGNIEVPTVHTDQPQEAPLKRDSSDISVKIEVIENLP